jgi:hypothetical protein
MNYRLVKITTFYPAFLDQYYHQFDPIVSRPYRDQYLHLMSQAFANSDFYSTHLKELGVDAHEIISNADPLQQAWAFEHGIADSGKKLLIAQLKAIRPEIIFFQDALSHNGLFVESVRKEVPGVRGIIGWCCAPHTEEHLQAFRAFDLILSCSPGLVTKFRQKGLNARLLNHAFENSLLPRILKDNEYPEEDIFFAGSLYDGQDYHFARKKILYDLKRCGVKIRLHANLSKDSGRYWRLIAKQPFYNACWLLKKAGLGRWVARLPINQQALQWKWLPERDQYVKALRDCIQKPLFGIEMLRALSKCKIGFNCHIDATGEYAGNVRLFEITGVGACLLTDWKVNIHELFEPDLEIVTYTSADDLAEKVRWLMDHPNERKAIAARGQQRTIRDHSFAKRAVQLDEIIRADLL